MIGDDVLFDLAVDRLLEHLSTAELDQAIGFLVEKTVSPTDRPTEVDRYLLLRLREERSKRRR